MNKIRVLVVEDSLTVRKYIAETIAADSDLEVIGEAEDGIRAIELCQALQPDVITLDIVLPAMSGTAVTEYVMANRPTPILIVSSSTNRGEIFKTYDALAAGAVDVLEKPHAEHTEEWGKRLVATIKIVSRVKVVTHLRGRHRAHEEQQVIHTSQPRINSYEVVAIGASTGGPRAVPTILRALPSNFPIPLLLVLHLAPNFAKGFVEWLAVESGARVAWAEDGAMLPQPFSISSKTVIVAPPDRHLVVEHRKLRLKSTKPRNFFRPSVDVLFESIAHEFGDRAICCILTGMGSDGAEGLLAARQSGSPTIAQDEATSVVFGMPGEAIKIGAANQVLPVFQIAEEIVLLTATGAHE